MSRLESQKAELSALSVAEACTGSFWDERFGERGRFYIMRDAEHHVEYLISALYFKSPVVLANYARWLRGMLTVRGMCTRHLEEHFESLSDALEETIAECADAVEYLATAVNALHYDLPVPSLLQDRGGELVRRASEIVIFHDPAWFREDQALTVVRLRRDLGYLLSYLTDALALERPDVFFDYLGWIDDYFLRRGRDERYLPALLAALAEAAGELPESTRTSVLELIQIGAR